MGSPTQGSKRPSAVENSNAANEAVLSGIDDIRHARLPGEGSLGLRMLPQRDRGRRSGAFRAGEVSAGEATQDDVEAIQGREVAAGAARPKGAELDHPCRQCRGIFHVPGQET
jgi:hypothetical protein